MAQSAKDYASQQLGALDLSHLDNEKNVAQNVYNTSSTSLQNSFNNLMDQINTNRADTRQNFNTGRTTVAENAFNQNRVNQADLSARGVGTGGLQQLGELGNRIETGQQYSNLANEFYDDMGELQTQETQGKTQFDTDKQSLKNTLDQTLAGITSRGADATNQYNMTLGQLAEQVQGRWDANANAAAQAAATRAAAQTAAAAELQSAKMSSLDSIVNNSSTSYSQKVTQIATAFGVDNNMAQSVLREFGFTGSANVPTMSYNSQNDYIGQLLGR